MGLFANLLADDRALVAIGAIRQMQVMRLGRPQRQNRDFVGVVFGVAIIGFGKDVRSHGVVGLHCRLPSYRKAQDHIEFGLKVVELVMEHKAPRRSWQIWAVLRRDRWPVATSPVARLTGDTWPRSIALNICDFWESINFLSLRHARRSRAASQLLSRL
jgi:hypothetical protein